MMGFLSVTLKIVFSILNIISSFSCLRLQMYLLQRKDGTNRHSAGKPCSATSLHYEDTFNVSFNLCSSFCFMNYRSFLSYLLFLTTCFKSTYLLYTAICPLSKITAIGLLSSLRYNGSLIILQQKDMSRIQFRQRDSNMGLKNSLHRQKYQTCSSSAGLHLFLSLRKGSAIYNFIILYTHMIKEKMKFELVEKLLKEHKYKPIRVIGAGSFGEVFMIQDANGRLLAAKAISKASLKKKTYLEKYINQEIEIMHKLNHPNLVRNYLCLKSDFFLILINQYCNAGNVLKYQSRLSNKRIPLNEALLIVGDILKGLKAMHDLGFIHRDIKAENILIEAPENGPRIFKIADFGFARSISTSNAKTLCGTQKYMAPQVLHRQLYGEGADVWSLGVLLYFMLFSEFPFRGYDMKAIIKKRCTPSFTLSSHDIKQFKGSPIESLFQKIFVIEKENRIKINEIPYHPLFKDLKEHLIKEMKLENSQQPACEIPLEKEQEEEPPFENVKQDKAESESQIEPEDFTNSLITLKERVVATDRHLERELEEIKFEIEKVQYLKQSARCIFEMYKDYFNYTERIAARYYILKVFLVYAKPLLTSLEKLEMPASLKEVEIEPKKWMACTLTQQYQKILNKLRYMITEVESIYEDTFFYASRIQKQILIKNFQLSFKQDIENSFQEVKLSYRSVTAFYFSKIRMSENIELGLKIRMQMRIFCCHAINRIFKRNEVAENFPYFLSWVKKNRIHYDHCLDLTYFKKWIISDEVENLKQNLRILIEKYF